MRNSPTKIERLELQSWKEVASFLGISVRTAQKWETDLGLPIHRLGSGPGSRVTAFSDELEEWKLRVANETAERRTSERNVQGKFRHLLPWLIALAFAALLIATLIAFFIAGYGRTPVQWSLDRETFRVKDPDGNVLWSLQLPGAESNRNGVPTRRLGDAWFSENALLQDLDGDGVPEVTLIVRHAGSSDELRCYNAGGSLRWKFIFGRERHVGARVFENVYLGQFFIGPLLGRDGQRYLLAYGEQAGFYPSQLVLIDPVSGKVRSEYWHPGYLSRLSFLLEDLDGDGTREVMAGGFNNPEQGPGYAALLVLGIPFKDPQSSIRNIFGDPAGEEEAYILFSKPDVWDLKAETPFLNELFTADDSHFRATIWTASGDSHFRLLLDRRLNVVEARAGDQLARIHQELYLKGLIDHELNMPEIESWKRALRFRSAPDGNSREVQKMWQHRERTANHTQ